MAPSHDLNQWWNIVNCTHRKTRQWKFYWNSYIFIHENAFENIVCEMASTLFPTQCVNPFCAEFFIVNIIFVFFLSFLSTEMTGTWNHSFWKGKIYLSNTVNTLTADDLAIQGARAWSTMVLTYFALNWPVLPSNGWQPVEGSKF